MTVVSALQVDTDFLSDKHLEHFHGLISLGGIDQIVVSAAHIDAIRMESNVCFP